MYAGASWPVSRSCHIWDAVESYLKASAPHTSNPITLIMSTHRSPYDRYTLAQQELRDINFSISSEKVPGAHYVDGWHQNDSLTTGFPLTNSGYLPLDVIADLAAAVEQASGSDGGWTAFPSRRILKHRARRTAHRKSRDATSAWLGRAEEGGAPGTSLVESYNLRSDWVIRKDGSHELVTR